MASDDSVLASVEVEQLSYLVGAGGGELGAILSNKSWSVCC